MIFIIPVTPNDLYNEGSCIQHVHMQAGVVWELTEDIFLVLSHNARRQTSSTAGHIRASLSPASHRLGPLLATETAHEHTASNGHFTDTSVHGASSMPVSYLKPQIEAGLQCGVVVHLEVSFVIVVLHAQVVHHIGCHVHEGVPKGPCCLLGMIPHMSSVVGWALHRRL